VKERPNPYPVDNQWKALPSISGLEELQRRGLGIYQERFMLDDRLQSEIISEINRNDQRKE
jgi:hypothetical protein